MPPSGAVLWGRRKYRLSPHIGVGGVKCIRSRDQTGQPVVGMNVRFSIHGDTNTHLVNHGNSFLHQGEAITNSAGEVDITLAGQPPELFRLRILDKKYSYFNKTFNSSFWDSNAPVVFNIDRLVHNGDIDVSVSNHEGVVPLSHYIKSMYPGRDHYAVLRLDRAGVDPSLLNLTVKEDKVPLYGLPEGECTVKSLSVIVYGVNMNYNMVPLDIESGSITVKNNQIVPSPRKIRFSTGVTNQKFTMKFLNSSEVLSGVAIILTSKSTGKNYTGSSDKLGAAMLELPIGVYSLRARHLLYEPLDADVRVENGIVGEYKMKPLPAMSIRYIIPEKDREDIRPIVRIAPKSSRTFVTHQDGSIGIPFNLDDRFLIGSEYKDGYTYFHKYIIADKQQVDRIEIQVPERKNVELDTSRITHLIVDDDQTSLLLIRDGVSDIAQTIPIKQNMTLIPLFLVPDVYTIHLIRLNPLTDVSNGIAAINYSIVPVGKVTLDDLDKKIALEMDPKTLPLNLGEFFLELIKEWPGKRFIE